MKKIILVLSTSIFFFAGCAAPNKHILKIETTPTDAIVSIHPTTTISDASRQIIGVTPLATVLSFSESRPLWLEIEKRGYASHVEKVLPKDNEISVVLERIKDEKGEGAGLYALPDIQRILLIEPDIKVIERGFSSEAISEEKSARAQEELAKGVEKYFAEKYMVVVDKPSTRDNKLLRSLWRDVQSAMELLDPVRLKYLPYPPLLETKSSRHAATELGKKYKAEVLLFIKGKQNLETAGLQVGIAGTAIAGTAASFGGAYGRAFTNNDSIFAYNIYAPVFGKNTLSGKAALIDSSNGEVLWVNRGVLENVLTDLFMTLNHM